MVNGSYKRLLDRKKMQDMGLPPINVAVKLSQHKLENMSIAEKLRKSEGYRTRSKIY
jgi:hypothetical protein